MVNRAQGRKFRIVLGRFPPRSSLLDNSALNAVIKDKVCHNVF